MTIHRYAYTFRAGLAGALLAGCVASAAWAQPDGSTPPPPPQEPQGQDDGAPPPPPPPDAPPGAESRRPRPPMTREEIRTRLRQFLDQRAQQLRREQDDIERAIRMFDEGKSIEDIQAAFPDRPGRPGGRRGGGAGGGGGGIGEWILRWQDGEPPFPGEGRGPGGPGGPGGPDGPMDGDRPRERGPGPQGQPAPERDPNQPLTSEERETIRDFIRSTAPQMLAPLDELEKRDPSMAEKKYRDMLRKTRMLQELRKRDRPMYDLRLADIKAGREAIESARAIARLESEGASPGGPEVERETSALRAALEAQFTARSAIRRNELARGRDRIADEEKDIASRESRREQLITESMSKMVDSERRRLSGRDGDAGPEGPRPRRPGDDQRPPRRPDNRSDQN